MLAHLEDLNLTALQLNIRHGHFLLRHDLNRNIFAGLLVNGGLDEAELTLTERLLNIVEVVQSRVPNDFLDCLNPSELLV